MKEMIKLCNKDLKKSIFSEIMFFSLAEGGAMGEPGEVYFFDKEGQVYSFNYVYGDVDMKNVEKLFPVLKDCEFGMFGLNSEVPKGWKYVELGFGNHLIVNDVVYPKFKKILGNEKSPSEVYSKWMEIADSILNNIEEKQNGNIKSTIELIKGSCADQTVDVVVNAANKNLWEGGGICGVIFEKAGIELTHACNKQKTPLHDGEAVITPAFNMKNAKAIIHAVGPNFNINPNAFKELFDAYYNSLVVLKENEYHSISFPLISAGIFGGSLANPAAESTKQCCRAYKKFIEDFPDYIVDVKLCAYSLREMDLAKNVFEEYFGEG